MRRHPLLVSVIALLTTVSFPLPFAAEEHPGSPQHPRYKLVDLGTFGGPIAYGPANGLGSRLLNEKGQVTSYADTSAPDPFGPNFCFADCLLAHAFRWSHGSLQELQGFDDRYGSAPSSINDQGWATGQSQTGVLDLALGFPQIHAALWKHRKALDLGTLPGGVVSIGITVNNAGEVVGFSDNGVPDPFAFFPTGTETHTFLWKGQDLMDIGTLGGPDAAPGPGCDNQRPGVIVGTSYTSYSPNSSSGIPTQDPFLWDNGVMTNLGNLGGTFNFAQCINTRGEVIGGSSLPGDQATHAFLWRNGKMKDLGTLGGPLSEAFWINDSGDIAGSADLPTPGLHDAVLWKHEAIHDLGTLPGDPCSRAYGLNSRGQVVGTSTDCQNALHAFLWQDDGPMLDLNTLIPPGSGLQLTNAIDINNHGEILAESFPIGTKPHDDEDLGHLVLLLPCGETEGSNECRPDQSHNEEANLNSSGSVHQTPRRAPSDLASRKSIPWSRVPHMPQLPSFPEK